MTKLATRALTPQQQYEINAAFALLFPDILAATRNGNDHAGHIKGAFIWGYALAKGWWR